MEKSLTIGAVLDRIALLEQRTADLYDFYATLFKADWDLFPLFSRMTREEKNHKAQVLLQKRLLSDRRFEPVSTSLDLSGLDAILETIDAHMQFRTIAPIEALDFAIMLESHGMESAYRSVLSNQNPELARLAKALSNGDQYHLQGLKDMKDIIQNRKSPY